jgi:hypothetical protein
MRHLKNLCLPIVILALGSTARLSMAQTGPTGPVSQPSTGAPATTTPNVQRLTPEVVADLLRKQGHQVEQREQNGLVELICQIRQDGWGFQLEIQFDRDKKWMTFLSPLGGPLSQYSAAQLLDLLKLNYRLSPAHFVYRERDRRICFEDCDYSTGMSEAQFQNCLTNFLKKIRENHATWGPVANGSAD